MSKNTYFWMGPSSQTLQIEGETVVVIWLRLLLLPTGIADIQAWINPELIIHTDDIT